MNTLKAPIANDARYTCRLERSGVKRLFVVRFNGTMLVQATKLGGAIAVAQAHKKHREATLTA